MELKSHVACLSTRIVVSTATGSAGKVSQSRHVSQYVRWFSLAGASDIPALPGKKNDLRYNDSGYMQLEA